MSPRSLQLVIGLAVATWATGVPAATLTVTFVEPSRYADAGLSHSDVEHTTSLLEEHLQALAKRHLPPGQRLAIEVLDVDLAGHQRTLTRRPEVRVLRGQADWPSITLRYRLQTPEGDADAGEERLSDLTYLQMDSSRYPKSEVLRYEKQMLDDWFVARFSKHRAAAR